MGISHIPNPHHSLSTAGNKPDRSAGSRLSLSLKVNYAYFERMADDKWMIVLQNWESKLAANLTFVNLSNCQLKSDHVD